MSKSDHTGQLSTWFRQWRTPLRKFLAAKGAVRSADLDDVAQEVFLRLLRYETAELVEHPRAYLYKVASNVAAEWAIRSRNLRPHDSKWLDHLPAEARPEDELMHAELQRELLQAISGLPARQRALLKLRFMEGLSQADAAERLAISPRIAKRQIIRSYARLRDQLNQALTDRVPHGRE